MSINTNHTSITAPIEKPFNILNTINSFAKDVTKEITKVTTELVIKDHKNIDTKESNNPVKSHVNIVEEHPANQAYQKVLNPTNGVKESKTKDKEDVYFINGILTKPKSAENSATTVANLINKPVKLLYNPTEGFVNDVLEAAGEVFHLPVQQSTVNDTADQFYNTLKSGKELKVIGHSQGAAITAQALTQIEKRFIQRDKLTKPEVDEYMKKVTVVTVGGASSKDDFPEAIKLVERKNTKDIVPKLANDIGKERPENLLYEISETKDPTKKEGLWKKYTQKLDERTYGKMGGAFCAAVVGAVSIVCEYNSIKAGKEQAPKKAVGSANVADLQIIDIVNKYHSTTEYTSGYLNNKDDCKAIVDAIC